MATVVTDTITTLEAVERHGALRRLVREYLVTGITCTNWDVLTEALDDAGVPAYGDELTSDTSSHGLGLVVVERNVTMVDTDKARVRLVYEYFSDIEEFIDSPVVENIGGEVRCNLQQKETYVDVNGDPITVQHTFANDDANRPGETVTQGKKVTYLQPQKTIHIKGIKQTRAPWLIADNINGYVNNAAFSGGAARTWLCTGCVWKLAWLGRMGESSLENRYYMDFEFQYDADTWDPIAMFIDEATGEPPPDLIEGTGWKRVEVLPSCNFESVIGARLQGG